MSNTLELKDEFARIADRWIIPKNRNSICIQSYENNRRMPIRTMQLSIPEAIQLRDFLNEFIEDVNCDS